MFSSKLFSKNPNRKRSKSREREQNYQDQQQQLMQKRQQERYSRMSKEEHLNSNAVPPQYIKQQHQQQLLHEKNHRRFHKEMVESNNNSFDYPNLNYNNMVITAEDIKDNKSSKTLKGRNQMATASQESKEIFRTAHSRDGLNTIHTQRIIRKTTTLTQEEKQNLEDDQLLRERLIRWAQKSTEGYPHLNVKDLSTSWKDGLVFNAILHRNRPELLDYRLCKERTNYENLNNAFELYDHECGIRRILEPEQVDNFKQDETAMFYYIYSIYQRFPNPPERNPLLDDEKLFKIEEYKDRASRLLIWIRENISKLQKRNWPNTIEKMKLIQSENDQFRTEEIPLKSKEKQFLKHFYHEIARYTNELNVYIDHELSYDNIDIMWNRLLQTHQEREQSILDEIVRLERLERFAEKVARDIRTTEQKLDEIERIINEEEKKVHKLHPLESKFNIDLIENELRFAEERIRQLFDDVSYLKDENYHSWTPLQRKVEQLEERLSYLNTQFQDRVVGVLDERRKESLRKPLTEEDLIASKEEFCFLDECIKWVKAKITKLNKFEFSSDLPTIEHQLQEHQIENRTIINYQSNVEKCNKQKSLFKSEELAIYSNMLERLNKLYNELCTMSNKLLNDLDSLIDFLQKLIEQLNWIESKQEIEELRDWSIRYSNLEQAEHEINQLNEDINRHQIAFTQIVNRGESLIRQKHQAKKTIEHFINLLQFKYNWLKNVSKCSSIHLKHSSNADAFYEDANNLEKKLLDIEHKLNTKYSQTNFNIEEGEQLLKEMQQLKVEINEYSSLVNDLIAISKEIVPMKARRPPIDKTIKAKALFLIKKDNFTIYADEICTLKENSNRTKWRLLTSSGYDVELSGVCFSLNPPDQEAIDLANSLKKLFEDLMKLWAAKHHKLRCNLILATLNVVKDWDYDTYINMDPIQRNAIIKALDDDIDKVVREGPPNDPDSKRLQDEMKALKKKFSEFDEKYRNQQNDLANQKKIDKFIDTSDNLLNELREKEKILKQRCEDNIPRSIEYLNKMISEHRDFEYSVKRFETSIEQARKMYNDLPRKSKKATEKLEELNETWSSLNKLMGAYSDRLKDLTTGLNSYEDCSKLLKTIENKLNIRDDKIDVKRIISQLRELQTEMHYSKHAFDQLIPNFEKVKNSTKKTREQQNSYSDIDQFESDCKNLIETWNKLKDELRHLQSKIEAFNLSFERVDNELNNLKKDDVLVKPISCDQAQIKQQKNEFKQFLRNKVEPLGTKMQEIMDQGEKLIENSINLNNYGKIDSAKREIKRKMDILNDKWNELQNLIKDRLDKLNNAIDFSSKFWDQHAEVMQKLKEIKQNILNQEPPALEPSALQIQIQDLEDLKTNLKETRPKMDDVHASGKQLMTICSEREKPEVRKNLEEMESLFDNINNLIQKREKLLDNSLNKAQLFHQLLQELLDFLEIAENKLSSFGEIPLEIDLIKNQIKDLKEFKRDVERYFIEIDRLNKLGKELMDGASKSQINAIKEPLNEVNKRWTALIDNINNKEKQLEDALLRLGQFQHALKDFLDWLNKVELQLSQFNHEFVDLSVIEFEISKHKNLMNEIKVHKNNFETLNKAGKLLIESKNEFEDVRSTEKTLEDLNDRWSKLNKQALDKESNLDDLHKEISKLHFELIDTLSWINEIDVEMTSKKQIGGLPETAKENYDNFMHLYNEIQDAKVKIETLIFTLDNKLSKSKEDLTVTFNNNLKLLKTKWQNLLNKSEEYKTVLEKALNDAKEYDDLLKSFLEFLSKTESYLNNLPPVSKILSNLEIQIDKHTKFCDNITNKKEQFQELDRRATQLKYFCQKQDVIVIKNTLISIQNRWEKIQTKSIEYSKQLELSLKEVKEFVNFYNELMDWIKETEIELDSTSNVLGNDAEKIRSLLLKHNEFQRKLSSKLVSYETVMKMGKNLISKAPKNEIPIIQDMLDELKNRWNALFNKSINKQRKLEEALLFSGQFKDAIKSLLDWLETSFNKLNLNNLYGDLDTVNKLIDHHKIFLDELNIKSRSLNSIKKTANELLESVSSEDANQINQQLNKLESDWLEINRQSEKKSSILEDALKQAEKMHKMIHSLLEWLSDAELKLRFQGPLPEDEQSIKKMIKEHDRFIKEMAKQEVNKNTSINFAEEILTKAHPEAISVINHWITIIQARWDEVASWSKQWAEKLTDLLSSYENVLELIEQLMSWLNESEILLKNDEIKLMPEEIETIEKLIKQHQIFIDEMTNKQSDFERIVRIFSNQSIASRRATSTNKYIKKWRTSTPNLTSELNINVSDVKNPKVRELVEKWKTVWQMSMDRLKRLQEKLDYLNDKERTKNFNFEEWKNRFSGWVKNQHGKLLDFYKKIDHRSKGKLTYDEFIEGFLSSKFTTFKAEMEKVAPIFDRNFDTFIDQKEFLDVLRSEVRPKTEDEIIMDEVQKQVSKCNCLNKFKVYQVGEGKYRFGESQTLRLVRILRSTIMVRVGGGWLSFNEFLLKNDPCRVKGRTNLMLRDHLSDGISQETISISSKSQKSRGSNEKLSNYYPLDGPISKIREKTERSLPIVKTLVETTDYSYTEETVTKPNNSRFKLSGNRGLSREASDLSADSIDELINKF